MRKVNASNKQNSRGTGAEAEEVLEASVSEVRKLRSNEAKWVMFFSSLAFDFPREEESRRDIAFTF